VTRVLAGIYNYSYYVTDDSYGNIFPIPSMKNWNQSEPELTVYRTRTKHENILKYSEQERNRTVITKEPKQYSLSPMFTKAAVGLYWRSQVWIRSVEVCNEIN